MKKQIIVLAALALSAAISGTSAAAPTAMTHIAKKVPCQSCHVTGDQAIPVRKEACLQCHGSYQAVADKTRSLHPNPHDSHFGDRDCSTCHRGHKPSVLTCDRCHQFDLKTP